jgi:hypothetical protein
MTLFQQQRSSSSECRITINSELERSGCGLLSVRVEENHGKKSSVMKARLQVKIQTQRLPNTN